MQSPFSIRASIVLACVAALSLNSGAALAEHGGGGGHFGGGGGGHYGGGGQAHYGGGYHGGYGGGYGYRGGYGGWHGGYGGWRGGYYGGWGWGLGLGAGLYFATLPLYYSTLWWGGIPYYYADNTYYRYDGTVGQYQTVVPPEGLQQRADPQDSVGTDLIAYPKNGQSEAQQAQDKYECHHWASTQTGFDPTQGASAAATGKRSDYLRAQAACLDGRGYSVK